jgi:hypothetical protein
VGWFSASASSCWGARKEKENRLRFRVLKKIQASLGNRKSVKILAAVVDGFTNFDRRMKLSRGYLLVVVRYFRCNLRKSLQPPTLEPPRRHDPANVAAHFELFFKLQVLANRRHRDSCSGLLMSFQEHDPNLTSDILEMYVMYLVLQETSQRLCSA